MAQGRQIACKISAFLSLISYLCAEKWLWLTLFLPLGRMPVLCAVAACFKGVRKKCADMEKTMSYVGKIMSDIIQITSDIILPFLMFRNPETYAAGRILLKALCASCLATPGAVSPRLALPRCLECGRCRCFVIMKNILTFERHFV